MNYEETIAWADVILLLVDHKEFKALDKSVLNGKKLVDTNGLWN